MADPENSWNLCELFASDAQFSAEISSLSSDALPALRLLIQKIDSPETLKAALEACDGCIRRINRVQCYAGQKADLNAADAEASTEKARAQNIQIELSLVQSSLRNILLSKDGAFWQAMLSSPALQPWQRSLSLIKERAAHCLPDREENLLAASVQAQNNMLNVFTTLSYSEMPWKTIKNPDGQEVTANYSGYSSAMHNPCREYRRQYYETFLGTVGGYRNTFAQNLSAYTQLSEALAEQHGYKSLLDSQMQQNELSIPVYEALIEGARASTEVLARENSIRRGALGFQKLYTYDKVAPIGDTAAPVYSYAEAQKVIKNSLSILGADYVRTLETAFSARWIDLYPAKGKATGAYSGGALDLHPWILSNFTNDYYSVSTLAHELGHAVHQARSYKKQKSEANREVQPLGTEVCSIANEILLANWLIDHAADPAQKLFFVQQELSTLRNTFFSQVFYADFEWQYHLLCEKGGSLCAQELDSLYLKISSVYYPGYEQLECEGSYWALIPHFYYNYYLYSYAVDVCAACSLADRIYGGDTQLLARYQNYLEAGSSLSTVELFRSIDIDISGQGYIEPLIKRYRELLDMEESLLR